MERERERQRERDRERVKFEEIYRIMHYHISYIICICQSGWKENLKQEHPAKCL